MAQTIRDHFLFGAESARDVMDESKRDRFPHFKDLGTTEYSLEVRKL